MTVWWGVKLTRLCLRGGVEVGGVSPGGGKSYEGRIGPVCGGVDSLEESKDDSEDRLDEADRAEETVVMLLEDRECRSHERGGITAPGSGTSPWSGC